MTAEAQADAPASAGPAVNGQHFRRPRTDAAAIRDICRDLMHVHDRATEIKADPAAFHPMLVLSDHVRGTSILDKIADWVNRFCGSMWVFLVITVGIMAWLVLGPLYKFDPVPWPLLLTILNLPQLSIMISLQVSANRAQAASDKRAIADHETLIALHEMAKQQLTILQGQDRVLSMLDNFASKDMPGRQQEIQQTVNQILAQVGGGQATT
jgi:low affinity Fe/Cu permease